MTAIPIDQPSTPLAYALAYARRGWHVLPLEPRTKRPHRFARNGVYSATTDAEQVRHWWTESPDAGIGVSMGASGLCAFDIDPRNNGLLTLEALEARYGKIESDVTAFTPGGGMHLVFTAPPSGVSMPATLGSGIDVKFNGYICVEPSIHPNGKQYVWEASSNPLDGAVPSPLPEWIRDFVTIQRPASDPGDSSGERHIPITDETWADIAGALKKISSDIRETWIKVGMSLQSTGESQRAFDLWDSWSRSSSKYNSADQMRVWRSFRSRGLDGITYKSIFAMAQPDVKENKAPRIDPDGLLLTITQLETKASSLTWAVKHAVPENSIGMLFGASGTFKSFIAIDYALHRAYGMPWMGRKTKPGIPIYLAAEGGAGLFRRVQAWHLARGMDWKKCPMVFCITPLTIRTQSSVLRDQIRSSCPKATDIIIDTLSQTYTGNENQADDMADYFRSIGADIRNELGIGSLIVHHSGHSATERPRGSSVITANIDFLFGAFRQEGSMGAYLCCLKQKDGELFDDAPFSLSKVQVGKDEDEEPITSLSATFDAEDKAGTADVLQATKDGRKSKVEILRGIVKDLMKVDDLRQEYIAKAYDKDDKVTVRARNISCQRAIDALEKEGFLWVDEGFGRIVRLGKKGS